MSFAFRSKGKQLPTVADIGGLASPVPRFQSKLQLHVRRRGAEVLKRLEDKARAKVRFIPHAK